MDLARKWGDKIPSLFFIEKKEVTMVHNEKLIKIFEYALNQEETGKRFFLKSLFSEWSRCGGFSI